MIKILDALYGQKTWVSYMLHMETHAVKLPAHSFCADVLMLMLMSMPYPSSLGDPSL